MLRCSLKTIGVRRVASPLRVLSCLAPPPLAAPYLVVDAGTGETIVENDATVPWYPASLTKLMTTYVALDAVARAG